MKYTKVNVRDCKTWHECEEAIQSIENDYENMVGGFAAWNSGYQCELLKGAQKKIDALERKQNKLSEHFEE